MGFAMSTHHSIINIYVSLDIIKLWSAHATNHLSGVIHDDPSSRLKNICWFRQMW